MSRTPRPASSNIDLDALDPSDSAPFSSKEEAAAETASDIAELAELHYRMFADNHHALIVVLQAMDAGGKDGAIRHLATGLSPQGMLVHSFKTPTDEELDHDYLWRVHRVAPGRGEVAIFNRSHYEEVLVPRIHPHVLDRQNLPSTALGDDLFAKRYRQINDFERILVENGTSIVKFMLLISKEEQLERIEARRSDPARQWKYSDGDLEERKHWKKYRAAYQEMIRATSTKHAPWYVIPADRKWFRNWAITRVVVDTLKGLDMKYPKLNERVGR